MRADGGDQAEEHEHEQLAEAGVAVGPRAAGVEPPGGDGDGADERSATASTASGQRQAGHGGDGEGEASPPASPPPGDARPDATSRTGPTRDRSSVPRTPSL